MQNKALRDLESTGEQPDETEAVQYVPFAEYKQRNHDVDLGDRPDAEKNARKVLEDNIAFLGEAIEKYNYLADTATNPKEAAGYLKEAKVAANDQAKLMVSLVKEFGFFSTLQKPMEENPEFTPVYIYWNTSIPEECIKQPRYTIDPNDVQNFNPVVEESQDVQ